MAKTRYEHVIHVVVNRLIIVPNYVKNKTNRQPSRKSSSSRPKARYLRKGIGLLLKRHNISDNASGTSHDNSRGHALHVVGDEGRAATVATIASGITAVFLVAGAAGIELEHSLRLTAKGAKGRENGELYGVMFDADGIIIDAGPRGNISYTRGVVKRRVTWTATLLATHILDAQYLLRVPMCEQVTDVAWCAAKQVCHQRQHAERRRRARATCTLQGGPDT